MGATETYELKHPFVRKTRVNGAAEQEETIHTVEVRRMNGGDMRWLEGQKGKAGASLGLLQRLLTFDGDAPFDQKAVDSLDAEDIAGLSELIESFLPASLRTGQGSLAT
ncbi:MAG TPA: hypothetical protein VMU59_11435 [Caulobacteraceae bacterium]|nr:hypothetical protein [Caulobacteraceae bacterium]